MEAVQARPDSRSQRAEQPLALGGSTTSSTLARVGVLVVILVGLLLRLWVLGREPLDQTSAVPGMMAYAILHGHFSALYWGQKYGGVEPYVVAAVFAILGQSSFTLGLTPIILDAAAAILVWRIGRRLFGPSVGVGSGLLFWIWPEVYAFDSTQEWGFRYVTLVCGLAVMLLTLRLGHVDQGLSSTAPVSPERPAVHSPTARSLEWFLLGAFAGVGWWGSPEIAYYALPSAVFLGWRMAKGRIDYSRVSILLTGLGFFIGALPWLWNNLRSHLASLRNVNTGQPQGSYPSRLWSFFDHTIPMVLGLRLRADALDPVGSLHGGGYLATPPASSWVAIVGGLLYVAALIAIGFWIVVLIRRRQALLLVGAVLAFPFLFASSPFSASWQDGHYGLFLAPMLSLLVASGARAAFIRIGRPHLAVPIAVVVAGALTAAAVVQLNPYIPVAGNPSRSGWFTWHADPNVGLIRLDNVLERQHVRYIWASYWLSWEVDFEARGSKVLSSDLRLVRSISYYEAVLHAEQAAWLFVEPEQAAAAIQHQQNLRPEPLDPGCAPGSRCVDPTSFEALLAQQKIGYQVIPVAPFIVVIPDRPVPQAPLVARYQLPTEHDLQGAAEVWSGMTHFYWRWWFWLGGLVAFAAALFALSEWRRRRPSAAGAGRRGTGSAEH